MPTAPPTHTLTITHTCNCRGAYWSSTRAALQPLFHSTGLASYHQITAAAVEELETDLAAAAGEGAAVDMAAAMCNLTLKVCAPEFPACKILQAAAIVSLHTPFARQLQYTHNTCTQTQVVGEAAFGVKFEVMEKGASGRITENAIVRSAKYVLENTASGELLRYFLNVFLGAVVFGMVLSSALCQIRAGEHGVG